MPRVVHVLRRKVIWNFWKFVFTRKSVLCFALLCFVNLLCSVAM